ncbi:Sigma factor RpoE negative regulatory protein RseA [Klebsiella michiganensis E718]|nr:Sigma factor RpoE negative regulatory protein RseA [Klebsiella michiganensis E718]
MQKEKLSALMDGETLDNELLNELERSSEMQKNLGELPSHPRYAARRYE